MKALSLHKTLTGALKCPPAPPRAEPPVSPAGQPQGPPALGFLSRAPTLTLTHWGPFGWGHICQCQRLAGCSRSSLQGCLADSAKHMTCALGTRASDRLPCEMQTSPRDVAVTVPWACSGGKAGQGGTGRWGDEGEQVHSTQMAPPPWELWLGKARSSDLAKFTIWLEPRGWRKRRQERG